MMCQVRFKLESKFVKVFVVGSDDGAGNRQYVFLVPENNNDINQLWIEIDRGSGFSLAKK